MKQSKEQIGSCVITPAESATFARVSGDFNPLHIDPVLARRYQFGSTLIHGINGTLRALDTFFAGREHAALKSLQVTFSKPARQGDELALFAEQLSGAESGSTDVHMEVHRSGKKLQSIEFSFSDIAAANLPAPQLPAPVTDQAPEPADIGLQQAEGLAGSTTMKWDPACFRALFPNLAKTLPEPQCATILASTKIVGMICPGLNSVYARLHLTFATEAVDQATELRYRVTSVDARFSRVLMEVSNPVASGTIEAFFRPPPVSQASAADIATLVDDDRFRGQTALVIGGSRGLGEVTAKVLAAGGANTIITYASGHADATKVAADILANGGVCNTLKLDVLDGSDPHPLFDNPDRITHIYYMASPLIEKSDARIWDAQLFGKYTDFYLNGLANLLARFAGNPQYRDAQLSIYLPSTAFLDQPEKGFFEYSVCKAATESFALQIQSRYPRWRFFTPRLPRMLTDQTSGIAGLDILDSARHILASLEGH